MIYLLAMLLLPVVVGFGPSPPLQPAGTLVHKLKVAGWTDASPTLSPDGSKAYVGAGNTLLAVDTMSQTILWTFTSCRPITSKAIVSTDGQSIYAYLCWDVDDKSSFYNGVIAFNTTTGSELWRTRGIKGDILPRASPFINSREPDNGMLYFTTYKKTLIRVVACNTTDGTILWQWASTSTSKLYAYGDVSASGLIYLSRFPRQMTTINATSGTTVTEAFFQLTRDCGDIFDQGPVLSGDERTVYQNFGWVVVEPQPPSATVIGISSDLKNASDLKATFYAYETVVNTVVPNSVSTGDNARIYFGCLGGKVYCIRPALSAPRIRPDANNNTVWVFAADGDVRAAVVLDKDEEVLYVGTLGSSFYALNASTGVLLWSFKTGGEIHSTAQISADGKLVYFGSRDNHIYAISTGKGKAERRA